VRTKISEASTVAKKAVETSPDWRGNWASNFSAQSKPRCAPRLQRSEQMDLASSYCPAPAVYLDISGVFAPRRNIGACCANAQEGGVSNKKKSELCHLGMLACCTSYDSITYFNFFISTTCGSLSLGHYFPPSFRNCNSLFWLFALVLAIFCRLLVDNRFFRLNVACLGDLLPILFQHGL